MSLWRHDDFTGDAGVQPAVDVDHAALVGEDHETFLRFDPLIRTELLAPLAKADDGMRNRIAMVNSILVPALTVSDGGSKAKFSIATRAVSASAA